MPRRRVFRTWDDYLIPDTSVLRNKFTTPGQPHGESNPVKFRALEEGATAFPLAKLAIRPNKGRFGYDHMKAICRYIFQDVCEQAGCCLDTEAFQPGNPLR